MKSDAGSLDFHRSPSAPVSAHTELNTGRRAPTDESSPSGASVWVHEQGTIQPRILLDGLAMPESPRWHDGRLWFSNWGTRQIVAVDLDGNSEVVGEGPDGLGWATNWLPDGQMLITGR